MINQLAIIILAAGKSSRMNAIKQLIKIGDKTLIETVIETALSIENSQVYCVLGAYQNSIKKHISAYKKIQILLNNHFEKGLSSSIVTAIKHIKEKHQNCLILVADQPQMNPTFINQIIEKNKQFPTKIIATKYPENFGVPALFPSTYYHFLEDLTGDVGAKSLIKNHLENTILIDFKKSLLDLDTPEDVTNYLKLT